MEVDLKTSGVDISDPKVKYSPFITSLSLRLQERSFHGRSILVSTTSYGDEMKYSRLGAQHQIY